MRNDLPVTGLVTCKASHRLLTLLQGDHGSLLSATAPGASWRAGSKVNVSWSITANHGGGYQYRLCPANQELTEACFRQTPLAFTGLQSFRWADGTQVT